jgi:peptide methionine sulfoxide reductase msrA/msrB
MSSLSKQDIIGVILIAVAVLLLVIFSVKNSQSKEGENRSAQKNNEPIADQSGLTKAQYAILREGGTEAPYSSPLIEEKRKGTYYAADTKEPVFRSEDKYDSGTGWPSFTKPATKEAVVEKKDTTYGMERVEATTTLGGHLGHVFTDGPQDKGGLRYCINGDALYFVPDED